MRGKLHPFSESDLKYHVSDINFEAGDHFIPQDPRLIALAMRAGKKAWEMFPYLEARFGERGRRFTSSDSCWLVALTQLPAETVTARLRWLRSILAKRGIPTVILEGHLKQISMALKKELPDGSEQWRRFDAFLSGLTSERLAVDPRDNLQKVANQFEKRFRESTTHTQVASAAQLLVSAWIDENAGIDGALGATQEWFANPERFSNDWISTVDALIATLEQAGPKKC